MWTQTDEGRRFIEDVSRQVVQQVDVEELEFFDNLAAEYYENPKPLAETDSELGAGIEAFVSAVTPAAMAAATAVTINLIKDFSSYFQEASSPFIRELIKRLVSQERKSEEGKDSTDDGSQASEADTPPVTHLTSAKEAPQPLTQEQLEFLKKIARREARRYGLDAEMARNLANALIAAFALV